MKDSDTVIAVDNVTKRFRLRGTGVTLKSLALDRLRGRKSPTFEALKNVSFTVKRAETLGIVGANGAGKSTLLALIAGTMEPNAGRIDTKGTIASLLELGAGFHPDLTGRENVYLYGAIMGIPRRRMRERFDAIHDFSGIEAFIDQPVKHYSSGMYVRLGFAVAVEVDPDILLIDEVLAVGDESFQRRCLDKMAEFRRRGKTLLIISHDLQTIRSHSDRILFLEKGEMCGIGDPSGMVNRYREASSRRQAASLRREWGTGEVRLGDIRVLAYDGGILPETLDAGQGILIEMPFFNQGGVSDAVFGFGLADAEGHLLYGCNTQMRGLDTGRLPPAGVCRIQVPSLSLGTGLYHLSFAVHSADHSAHYHRMDHVMPLRIHNRSEFAGAIDFASEWSIATASNEPPVAQ